MDAILKLAAEEVQKVAQNIDEGLRRRTIDKLRELQYALETPEETMQRLMYAVGIKSQVIQSNFLKLR
jgi:demethylsterigmatocystin 6-O-methyltransferase